MNIKEKLESIWGNIWFVLESYGIYIVVAGGGISLWIVAMIWGVYRR